MRISDAIEGAAGLIEAHGHWKGDRPFRGNGGHCVMTSVATATAYDSLDFMDRCVGVIQRAVCWPSAAQWSDTTDTPTVISTLRAIAAIERAREARLLPVVREQVTA